MQTTIYRRKKLRENLNKLLEPAGLLVTQMNIIKPSGKEHGSITAAMRHDNGRGRWLWLAPFLGTGWEIMLSLIK